MYLNVQQKVNFSLNVRRNRIRELQSARGVYRLPNARDIGVINLNDWVSTAIETPTMRFEPGRGFLEKENQQLQTIEDLRVAVDGVQRASAEYGERIKALEQRSTAFKAHVEYDSAKSAMPYVRLDIPTTASNPVSGWLRSPEDSKIIAKQAEQLAALRVDNNAQLKELKDMGDTIIALRFDLDSAVSQLEDARRGRDEARREVESSKEDADRYREENIRLKSSDHASEIRQCADKILELHAELKSARRETANWRNSFEREHYEVDHLHYEVDRLSKKLEDIKASLGG